MTKAEIMREAHKRTKADMAWQNAQKHLYVRSSYAHCFALNLRQVYFELKPVYYVTPEMMTDGIVRKVG